MPKIFDSSRVPPVAGISQPSWPKSLPAGKFGVYT